MTEAHLIEGQEVTLFLNQFGKTWDWSFAVPSGQHGSNLDGRCPSEQAARDEALAAARSAVLSAGIVPD